MQLGSRLVNLMCVCEYVGNGVKDLVCAPRPMGHPKGAGKTKLLLSEKGGRDDANIHALVSHPLSLAGCCIAPLHIASPPKFLI